MNQILPDTTRERRILREALAPDGLGGKVKPLLATTLLAAGLALSPVASAAELSAAEVGQQIAQTYPVKVLSVRNIEFDGRTVYAVKVMTKGGDFDDAFQVNTIIVDADTGKPIPVFRHRDSGYILPDAGNRKTKR